MRFVFGLFILLEILESSGEALKVFKFTETILDPGDDNLSFVTLANHPTKELPDKFIICSSHKQGKVDGKSFYVLYDDDHVPWLSVSIWEQGESVNIWADVQNGVWLNLGKTGKPWTNF